MSSQTQAWCGFFLPKQDHPKHVRSSLGIRTGFLSVNRSLQTGLFSSPSFFFIYLFFSLPNTPLLFPELCPRHLPLPPLSPTSQPPRRVGTRSMRPYSRAQRPLGSSVH